MLSRNFTFAGLFWRNDHQPARSRARTKAAVDLEFLEHRELLSGAHYPKLEPAREIKTELRLMNLNAGFSHIGLKAELRILNLAQESISWRRITLYRGGGPSSPATQIPPKVTLLSLGMPSANLTLPTITNHPVTSVTYTAPSGPATTLIGTPVASLPTQPRSPEFQPTNAPSSGLPTTSSPSTPGPAPIVPIDVITSGPVLY